MNSNTPFWVPVLTALSASLLGYISSMILRARRDRQRSGPSLTLPTRIAEHADALRTVSTSLQSAVAEMEDELRAREHALASLEDRLAVASERERDLAARIEILSRTEPEAARAFAELSAPAEKRSERRDYTLFFGGVVASFVTSLVLNAIGIG